jgi:hypothetical protein
MYTTAFVTKMMEWERRRPVSTGRNVPGHKPSRLLKNPLALRLAW